MRKRDWDTARAILAGADPEHLSYYVTVAGGVRDVTRWITGPIREEPDSALPVLIRGAALVSLAWEVSEAAGESGESPEVRQAWAKADECLDEALRLDPACADAWAYKIEVSRAAALPVEERWRRFHRMIEIYPGHWYGHVEMLMALAPEAGGTTGAMLEFARTRAAACPATHIPALVVRAHLAHHAHLEKLRNPAGKGAIADWSYLERDDITDEIWDAGQLSVFHDDYHETLLTPIPWNLFAYAFTYGDILKQASNLYEVISDDWITREPWGDMDFFLASRAYTHRNLG
ncbi:hypothetical protein MB27_24370 [Actinoplanes utahensis]|uniref:DUF4034 domain-containing protein n=2 Tax=Actinoplanes utahensis TaxID=1869 RepID=A0A0A6ULP1_ACTUT|nr:hypothetical protein MB27_24370 [Actinoplanes utahensis]